MSEIFQASEKYFEYVEYLCTINPKSASLNLQSPEFLKKLLQVLLKPSVNPHPIPLSIFPSGDDQYSEVSISCSHVCFHITTYVHRHKYYFA